jgi:alcohol dehydrogenase
VLDAAEMRQPASELGVDRALFPNLAREAAEQWTAKFNPRPVSAADFEQLYTTAFS